MRREEFLYTVFWMAESLRPTGLFTLNSSFESWAYRRGLHKQLARLEAEKFIEKHYGRMIRLTEAGREAAMGGYDPEYLWNRTWDGKFRFVVFDIEEDRRKERDNLRFALRQLKFGLLQKSVWLTPAGTDEVRSWLGNTTADPDVVTIIEGHFPLDKNIEEIINHAWNFQNIFDSYYTYNQVLDVHPGSRKNPDKSDKAWLMWVKEERLAWKTVCMDDPFLPRAACPKGYPGFDTYKHRAKIYRLAAKAVKHHFTQE